MNKMRTVLENGYVALHGGILSFQHFQEVFSQTALELNGVLNSCQKRCLFHHDLLFLLVPARVPVLVSLLLSSFFSRKGVLFHHDVLVCLGSGSGSGACLPFFSLLSFLRKGVLFHHDVLALRGSGSGAGACLPSSLFFPFSGHGVCSIMVLVPPGSGSGSVACPPSAFFLLFSGVISWFFLVPAGVPVLDLLLSSFFSSERGSVPS